MSNKIVVPEGMVDAIVKRMEFPTLGDAAMAYRSTARKTAEAAMLWLSENPILPTGEQLKALSTDWIEQRKTTPIEKCVATSVEFGAIEWQRRMCLVPDISRVQDIAQRCMGRTFTQEESEYLCNVIQTSTIPRGMQK